MREMVFMSHVHHIGIVSLSSGILGEQVVQHEVEIGLKRLKQFGMDVCFLPHALSGMDYIQRHPEARAQDLITALNCPNIDLVLCAIGGDDTYLTLPYLFENQEQIDLEQWKRKIFLGFSDTTVNHFALHRLGLKRTFYGQSFLSDICELSPNMLSYSAHYFDELTSTGRIQKLQPSLTWFKNRISYTQDDIGSNLIAHPNEGFQLLKGKKYLEGKILGGCVDTIGDLLFPTSEKAKRIMLDYPIFPTIEDWKDKILLLETSENCINPYYYRKILWQLKNQGVLQVVQGIIIGQPFDRKYEKEYQEALLEVTCDLPMTIIANINVGHSLPRGIVPFNVPAVIDLDEQCITFDWSSIE